MSLKIKIAPKLKKLIREYLVLREQANAAISAQNKTKTLLRNDIKTEMAAHEAPFGSYFVLDGTRISYEATVSDGVEPEHLFEEYEKGNITREQFLKCIRVSVTDTRLHLGGDLVAALIKPMVGKEVDIRVKELPVEEQGQDYFLVVDKPIVKRKVTGTSNLADKKPAPKSGRIINVRKS